MQTSGRTLKLLLFINFQSNISWPNYDFFFIITFGVYGDQNISMATVKQLTLHQPKVRTRALKMQDGACPHPQWLL